jgi:hypothetical protein
MVQILRLLRDSFNHDLAYNLTRPYPFGKWFKPTVIAGFLLFFGLFTTFNLATNGYDMQPLYTRNPNGTEAKRHWYHKAIFTWGDDKLNPKCQHLDISVGDEFMTTNLGLRYTVTGVFFRPGATSPWAQRSSLSYHNNTLTNCQVDLINVDLVKADNSEPGKHYWWSWMDSDAEATAHCDITNEDGLFTINFMVKYKTLSTLYNYVAIDNATTHASVWWGTRMLNNYFTGIQYVMSGPLPDKSTSTPLFTRAGISFHAGAPDVSIKDEKLFGIWYFFLASGGGIDNQVDVTFDVGRVYNNVTFTESRPLTEGLSFAKVFRSLVLVDLGNDEAPNLLLDPDLLQYALNPPDNFNRLPGGPLNDGRQGLDWWKIRGISPPGRPVGAGTAVPMNESFAKFQHLTGSLGTKNASINAQYICSQPMKKGNSTMALFTLVANFALLQVVWMVFKFLADQAVSSEEHAMYCEGCIPKGQGVGDTSGARGSVSMSMRSRRNNSMRLSSSRELLRDSQIEDGNTSD